MNLLGSMMRRTVGAIRWGQEAGGSGKAGDFRENWVNTNIMM